MLDGTPHQRRNVMTVAEAVREVAADFCKAGLPSAKLDARLLVGLACGLNREGLILQASRELNEAEYRRLTEFRRRRLAREPVSRIVGCREFWGRSFLLNASTLDPRPDSETLIEAVLAIVEAEQWQERPLRLLDLGTGSGCLLLSLLAELPHASGVGTDISSKALEAAKANADKLGLSTRADFIEADWLDGLDGRYDIIVSNPPYIATADISGLEPEVSLYDPHAALDGGECGFNAYGRIIPRLAQVTFPGSWAVFEIGRRQAQEVKKMLALQMFIEPSSISYPDRDLSGIPRVVAGKRQG